MGTLDRFLIAQEEDYELALQEVKNGKKENHWIWYIFPQIIGLGESPTSVYYSIKDLKEAKEYLENDILRTRLLEITNELLKLNGKNTNEIFGYVDALKVKSCMTLFEYVSDYIEFSQVLEKYYNNERDENTLRIIKLKNRL